VITSKPNVDFCPLCVSFAGQFIDQLLNIILNAGVVGGCADICNVLAEKTGSKVAGEVCMILCAVVGVKEFIAIVEKADLDPIYYCELLRACPINDNGNAKIASVTVEPKSGPQGRFTITMTFNSTKGTGTGEVELLVQTVDGIPVGDTELNQEQPAGTYSVSWKLKAEPNPDCDPTQGPCEMWLPGVYNISTAICNGECGSKHPHSQVYDQGSAHFTITQS
jgi:hypothetical protein